MFDDREYLVLGGTGRIGRAVVTGLLDRGVRVRVATRSGRRPGNVDESRVAAVKADVHDDRALRIALDGVRGAFVVNPLAYDDPDVFARAETAASHIAAALRDAKVPRVVALSSLGAQVATGAGILQTNHVTESALHGAVPFLTFVRSAYVMQNWESAIPAVLQQRVLPSFLSLDVHTPMVSASDVGDLAAAILVDRSAFGIVNVEGPQRYTARDVAAALGRALGYDVEPVAMPQDQWPQALGKGNGFAPRTIAAFVEMYAGLNAGSIAFEPSKAEPRHKATTLQEAMATLLEERGAIKRSALVGPAK